MAGSNWTEWSKFVLISIQNIQKALLELERNIPIIQSDIRVLEVKVEENDNLKNEIKELKQSIDEIKDDISALETTISINRSKLGMIITIASILITIIVQVGTKFFL